MLRISIGLFLSMLVATLARGQSANVLTVETSPAGSTQARYSIASTYCNYGYPQATSVASAASAFQVTTTVGNPPGTGCFGVSPPGPPATLIADLGFLRQGQYTLTWSFTGGLGYGTQSVAFNVTRNQSPTPIPAVTPPALALLSVFVLAAVAMRRVRRRCSSNATFSAPISLDPVARTVPKK